MKIYQVDSFTRAPFAGNPAAVCFLEEARDEAWMQAIASEINLSETAFCVIGQALHPIRYFTPEIEVPLCGHATLATAHLLWELGIVAPATAIRFRAEAGELQAEQRGERVAMNFPAYSSRTAEPPAEILEVLGGLPAEYRIAENGDALAVLESEEAVWALAPDFRRLATAPVEALCVTAPARSTDADFVSRYFAPRAGINEDPVTGVAHCIMAPYWFERLGRTSLVGRQISLRGGTVYVSASDSPGRVWIEGNAITIFHIEVLRPD